MYRAILRLDPRHADALHMLAALLTQLHGKDRVRVDEACSSQVCSDHFISYSMKRHWHWHRPLSA